MKIPMKYIPKHIKPPMYKNRDKRARKSGRDPHLPSILLIRKGYDLISRHLTAR